MKNRYWIYLSLSISLGIRILLVLLVYPETDILTANDQADYLKLSDKLLNRELFGFGFGSERMPLYPLFLAAIRLISDNLFHILGVQHLIGISIVPIMYYIGSFYSRRIAVASAMLAGTNLNFALQSNSILTESVFYPVFALFLFECMRYLKRGKNRHIALAGFYLGFCTLIRSATMYLPFFIIPFLIIIKGSLLDRIKRTLMFFVAFLIILTPWLLRNHFIFNALSLTTQGEPHLIGWVIPSVMQYEKNMNLSEATKESVMKWHEKRETMTQYVRENRFLLDKEAKRYAINYMRQASPVSITKAWFWGCIKNVFTPPFIELSYMLKMDWTHFYDSEGKSFPEQSFNFVFKNKNRTYSILLISGIILILLFRFVQFIGGILLLKTDLKTALFFCLVVGYILFISGPVGMAKYRLPFEPILILLTAYALDKGVNYWHLKREKQMV